MNAHDAAREHYLERLGAFERSLAGDPPWLRTLRRDATACFSDLGLPHVKLEEWRYTNVTPLAKIPFELPGEASVTREEIEAVSSPLFACSLFVFVDGRFAPELSATRTLSGDARVESLRELRSRAPDRLETHLGRCADLKESPFAALNTAFLDDGAVLFVPEGTRVDQPIHVVFVASGARDATVQHPRLLVVANRNSRAVVILDFVSLGDSVGFTNAVTEVQVEPNASLDIVVLQREGGRGFHFHNLQTRLERDARFSSHTLTLGGGLTRNDLSATLGDEGASCTLNGLFIGDGKQVIDNHTLVDHAMPHGTSRQLYKGILGGESRGIFRGRMIVRPDAQRTDSNQSNPNLLLTDGAEVDTKPQLEIYADDVKCSHGSSIGQLDEDAIFYLRSRGIDLAAARDVLTRGFAREILDALPVKALAESLDETLLARLRAASGREATR